MNKRRFDLLKRILSTFNLYSGQGPLTMQPQYIMIRKFFHFFGLYPYMGAMHFYYERANSFMAPKIYEYHNILRMTRLKKTNVVLDIGCGEGTLTLALAKKVKKVIGIDTGSHLIEDARFKARELAGEVAAEFYDKPLEKMDFSDECFDKIFSFSVIEHIPNYQEVFEETFRLLKKGGELLISVDSFSGFDPHLKSLHKESCMVQHYFNAKELHDLLTALGFSSVEIKPLFKSQFASRWFSRVIKDQNENFDFHKRLYSLFIYYKLAWHERKVKQNKNGIFLLARCVK